jgi:hypothetical protein
MRSHMKDVELEHSCFEHCDASVDTINMFKETTRR